MERKNTKFHDTNINLFMCGTKKGLEKKELFPLIFEAYIQHNALVMFIGTTFREESHKTIKIEYLYVCWF